MFKGGETYEECEIRINDELDKDNNIYKSIIISESCDKLKNVDLQNRK